MLLAYLNFGMVKIETRRLLMPPEILRDGAQSVTASYIVTQRPRMNFVLRNNPSLPLQACSDGGGAEDSRRPFARDHSVQAKIWRCLQRPDLTLAGCRRRTRASRPASCHCAAARCELLPSSRNSTAEHASNRGSMYAGSRTPESILQPQCDGGADAPRETTANLREAVKLIHPIRGD
jgi:hypothetical protein